MLLQQQAGHVWVVGGAVPRRHPESLCMCACVCVCGACNPGSCGCFSPRVCVRARLPACVLPLLPLAVVRHRHVAS